MIKGWRNNPEWVKLKQGIRPAYWTVGAMLLKQEMDAIYRQHEAGIEELQINAFRKITDYMKEIRDAHDYR